jgi:hypothetical protein
MRFGRFVPAIPIAIVAAVIAALSAASRPVTLTLDSTVLSDPPAAVDAADASVVRLQTHRGEITVAGRASPTSTVTVTVNGVVEGTFYVPAGQDGYRFEHVPMPSSQVTLLRVDASMWHVARLLHAKPLVYSVVDPQPLTVGLELQVLRSDTSGNAVARGTGPPSATVILYDSRIDTASTKPFPPAHVAARIRIDPDGIFAAPVSLAAGTHRVWGAMPGCDVLACASTPPETVVVDGSAPPPAQFRPQRSMTLQLGYQRLSIAVTAKLPRGDIIAEQIVEGEHGDSIVDELYGVATINGKPIGAFFNDTVPVYRLSEDDVDVTIRSEVQRPDDTTLPALAGRVTIADTPDSGPGRTWAADTVSVKLDEYTAGTPQPPPDRTASDGTITWDRPFTTAGGGRIAITLAFAPWSSFRALRDFLSLSVFAFLPQVIARFVAFAGGLVFAIPMLAYLTMTRRRRGAALRTAARLLTAICVAPDVFAALAASQPDVNDFVRGVLPGLHGPAVTDLAAPLVCGAVLALAVLPVAIALDPWKRRVRGELIRESAFAIATACGLFAATAVATYAVHSAPHLALARGTPYLALVTLAIAAVMTTALATCGFYKTENGRIAWRFIGLAAAAVLVTALPVAFARYITWASTPALASTILDDYGAPTGLVLDYLRQAAVLCDFSFGLALIAVVFLTRGGNGLTRPQLLRLALCCYAVPATVSIFLIPVTFALAWLTFGAVLDAGAVTAKCASLIRANRARAVTDLLLWPKTDDLTAKMRDLTAKYIDGDLDDAQLAARTQRLNALLDKQMRTDVAYAFGVGPLGSARANGRVGLWVASAFVVAHVLLFLATETATLRVAHSAYTLLVVAAYVATGIAQFVVPAFVFGACYELIRGRSGLQKAITVAAWAIACSLPSWLVSLPSTISVVSIVVETALFYTVLGFVFDAMILRESRSVPFRLQDVPKLSGVPALSWAGTVVCASLGVAIGGVLSGQVQNVAASTITSVYHQAALGQ